MNINLNELPELTEAIDELADAADAYGITFDTADFGGVRTQADTTQILQYRADDYAAYAAKAQAEGKTPISIAAFRPIAPWGHSFHDFGAARDLKITSKPDDMTTSQALAQLGALAADVGLRWGGTFHNPDPAHFELAITLSDAAARWSAFTGGTNVAPGSGNNAGAALLGALVVIVLVGLPAVIRAFRH